MALLLSEISSVRLLNSDLVTSKTPAVERIGIKARLASQKPNPREEGMFLCAEAIFSNAVISF